MEYIEALQDTIKKTHGCDSEHIESVPITETFKGKPVWSGVVEVFNIQDHPEASKCYAWGHHLEEENKKSRYVTVLNIPPVNSPLEAVRAAIISELK
ncbi:MAG: hypothetical protein H8E17_12970 [Deltaproteobacteria bacterium]|nr:hypothetical protein [Deltaproteobacteria bacterium]